MKNNMKRILSILSLLIILLTGGCILLLYNNNELKIQIEKRDILINDKQINDSIFLENTLKNKKIIERYINDCGILINGKKVTTEELLIFITRQIEERDKLQNELVKCKDSLSIARAFNELTRKNLKVNFNLSENDSIRKYSIRLPLDSSIVYKKIIQSIEKEYGIKYTIQRKDDVLYYQKSFSKVDSALLVYKYYKSKLHSDESGDLFIDLPEQKKIDDKRKK